MRPEFAQRPYQFQPSPYRSLGVVLMGLRISKIDEYAVTQILRHEPAETTHDLSGASVIGRNDLAQVLRVHTR
jgi:hypothetical protein